MVTIFSCLTVYFSCIVSGVVIEIVNFKYLRQAIVDMCVLSFLYDLSSKV